MKEYIYKALILKHDNLDAAYIEFPYDVHEEFGKKGQVKVKALFDGFEYRGSLIKMGTPCHIIGLNKKVREAIKKKAGDTVSVVITEDKEERTVEIPEDLSMAFSENAQAKIHFDKLSFTNRREYAEWITSARMKETRDSRVVKCIRFLLEGKKNPTEK